MFRKMLRFTFLLSFFGALFLAAPPESWSATADVCVPVRLVVESKNSGTSIKIQLDLLGRWTFDSWADVEEVARLESPPYTKNSPSCIAQGILDRKATLVITAVPHFVCSEAVPGQMEAVVNNDPVIHGCK